MFKSLILLIALFLFLQFPNQVLAQSATPSPVFEAVVSSVSNEQEFEVAGIKQFSQDIEVTASAGDKQGQTFKIEKTAYPVANARRFSPGDRVLVMENQDPFGKQSYFITDHIRRTPLYWLLGLFLATTVLIGRKRGLASIIGMAISFMIIFSFVLPQIRAGHDPITIAILASMAIVPITFYLSHGFNRKTSTAVLGTFIALIITGMLANYFVDAVKLSGFASEEASFLQANTQGLINIRGLLLAGIIISVLGILDDITVSQAAIVYQLKSAAPHLRFKELYTRAMDVGRDHIASVVNTLILVYTGAALPLLLLFIDNPRPFSEVINHEIIADEIVRTLVSSIGLILAVPVTTILAAYWLAKRPVKS